MGRPPWIALLSVLLAAGVAGCGFARPGTAGGSRVRIVAAENFWGSIAEQLGGDRARVQSIIIDPAQDPHSYERVPADARTFATAQLAIVNGGGLALSYTVSTLPANSAITGLADAAYALAAAVARLRGAPPARGARAKTGPAATPGGSHTR